MAPISFDVSDIADKGACEPALTLLAEAIADGKTQAEIVAEARSAYPEYYAWACANDVDGFPDTDSVPLPGVGIIHIFNGHVALERT